MRENKSNRAKFDPDNIPVVGSLGLLALGDVAFEAWRKVKMKHKQAQKNAKK
ncbi:MAG: hypothetical protein ACWA5P_04060 [bacterium]